MSGRCLEGPDWTSLAKFGSERYWVVSECCLDTIEGVWKVHLCRLERTFKVSGRLMEGVLLVLTHMN